MSYSSEIELAPAWAVANQIATIQAMRVEGSARVAAYHHTLSLQRGLAETRRLVETWDTL